VITFRKAAYTGLAIAATGAVLAGCASAPTDDSTGGSTPAASDFLPCMISDAGGFDDHSFNELGKNGIDKAAKELNVDDPSYESKDDGDYEPNIQAALDKGCTLIITVGFNLSAATVTAALANPDIDFAIVDDAADNDFDGKTDAPNIKPLLFDTAQAAFLGGYVAASYTKTGIVGTFGGDTYPTVEIFMDGYAQGVDYYNQQKGKDVKVVGWDQTTQTGTFVGGEGAFAGGPEAKAKAQGIIDQGADVILPVGGPDYQPTIAAIQESGKDIVIEGVDSDTYVIEADPKTGDASRLPFFLTSVQKKIDEAVYDTVIAAGKGQFDVTPYIGTLANDGVALAPFHDFQSKVDPSLQGELDSIKADIISGKIKVKSYLASN